MLTTGSLLFIILAVLLGIIVALFYDSYRRSPKNPVKGWYGLKKGLRGRFGVYLPPLLESLGLAELTHDPKNNRMRAK